MCEHYFNVLLTCMKRIVCVDSSLSQGLTFWGSPLVCSCQILTSTRLLSLTPDRSVPVSQASRYCDSFSDQFSWRLLCHCHFKELLSVSRQCCIFQDIRRTLVRWIRIELHSWRWSSGDHIHTVVVFGNISKCRTPCKSKSDYINHW